MPLTVEPSANPSVINVSGTNMDFTVQASNSRVDITSPDYNVNVWIKNNVANIQWIRGNILSSSSAFFFSFNPLQYHLDDEFGHDLGNNIPDTMTVDMLIDVASGYEVRSMGMNVDYVFYSLYKSYPFDFRVIRQSISDLSTTEVALTEDYVAGEFVFIDSDVCYHLTSNYYNGAGYSGQVTRINFSSGTYAAVSGWQTYTVPYYDPDTHFTDTVDLDSDIGVSRVANKIVLISSYVGLAPAYLSYLRVIIYNMDGESIDADRFEDTGASTVGLGAWNSICVNNRKAYCLLPLTGSEGDPCMVAIFAECVYDNVYMTLKYSTISSFPQPIWNLAYHRLNDRMYFFAEDHYDADTPGVLFEISSFGGLPTEVSRQDAYYSAMQGRSKAYGMKQETSSTKKIYNFPNLTEAATITSYPMADTGLPTNGTIVDELNKVAWCLDSTLSNLVGYSLNEVATSRSITLDWGALSKPSLPLSEYSVFVLNGVIVAKLGTDWYILRK